MRDALLRLGTRTVAVCVFVLLVAGALVTSTESGLAVPDWPLSYGKVMPPMVGGILYEHGHRLIAAAVSTLVGLEFGGIFFFYQGTDKRKIRMLSGAAFGAILLQALLGGLTVLFLLPPAISSAHAALAEIVFALTAVVALRCSRTWETLTSLPLEENLRISSKRQESGTAFRWTIVATAAIYVQIVLGAVVRHTGAGLVVPDFPTVFGGLFPSAAELARRGVAIHLAHRLGALVVLVLVARAAHALARASTRSPLFAGLAAVWTSLVAVQILFGALSIWSLKSPVLTVAHLGCGALCWVTGVLTCACLRAASRNPGDAISSLQSV